MDRQLLKNSGLDIGEIVSVWSSTLNFVAESSEIIRRLFMNYEIEHVGIHLIDMA